MSGLKSGAGDDLWDDEDEKEEPGEAEDQPPDDAEYQKTEAPEAGASTSETESGARTAVAGGGTEDTGSDPGSEGLSVEDDGGSDDGQPYIVRRAIRDKSVQFERDERLTFFVHRDVVDGERELVNEVESALGRDVPKFDVREAVYRAALRNREDVLGELLEMGYTLDEDGS